MGSGDSEAVYEPFAGGDDFVHLDFFPGSTHGMSIYANSHELLSGEASIGLSDSSGTAFAGADLDTQGGVDDWLVNHFDISLFDTGSWWGSSHDGGGGGSGRFIFAERDSVTVPAPSSSVMLPIGLFLLGLAGCRRPRHGKRRGQA